MDVLVQHQTGHLGASTAKPMILAWLDSVLDQRSSHSKRVLRMIHERNSWAGYIARCSPDERATSTWNVWWSVLAHPRLSRIKPGVSFGI